MPFTYIAGKAAEEVNSLLSCSAGEKGTQVMEVAEVGPVSPISQPHFGSLVNEPVGSVSPRSKEKTSELTLVLGRSRSQELSCGVRGKSEQNLVRK